MKKIYLFLVFLLLLSPTILSANLEMNSEFNSGETLIAKLSGNFQKPISNDNIFFYRGHVRASMQSEITKINEDYYIYAILPNVEETTNYSISIENIGYIEEEISKEKIEKAFMILETKADFNVVPGFIKTEKDFSLILQNLKQEEIEVKINEEIKGFFSSLFGSSNENSVILNAEKDKKIYFRLEDFDESFSKIKLTSNNTLYEIPVFIFSLKQEEEEEQNDYTIPPEEKEEPEKEVDIQTEDECNILSGTICPKDKVCDGDKERVYKGLCCLGECVEKPPTPPWKILGWGIIILVILIIIIFFRKYKRITKPFDLLNIARGNK